MCDRVAMSSYLIREMPVDERPRERLKNRGPGALTEAELVAILTDTKNAMTLSTIRDPGTTGGDPIGNHCQNQRGR